MKSVRIYEYGSPDTLMFALDAPEPAMDADNMLVETVAPSVNTIDWKASHGKKKPFQGPDLPLP